MAKTTTTKKATKTVKEPKVAEEQKKEAVKAAQTEEHHEAEKQSIIEQFAQHKGDTGSPEVQIALLSSKIQNLADHLEINKKDTHSRRGLLKSIAKRRRMLNYLKGLDNARYTDLIKKLNLKK